MTNRLEIATRIYCAALSHPQHSVSDYDDFRRACLMQADALIALHLETKPPPENPCSVGRHDWGVWGKDGEGPVNAGKIKRYCRGCAATEFARWDRKNGVET